ncbi:MAG TPA: CopG family transcriptional regulator, partial [Thermoprotei archaeon]|nr:CopG family transcriptional regulator [Thermoprotei archaeon]
MNKTKFGVYIPRNLLNEIDRCMQDLNISNRSKIIQEALQLFLLEHKWKYDEKVGGIIGVLYRHGNVDNILTEIQHTYID